MLHKRDLTTIQAALYCLRKGTADNRVALRLEQLLVREQRARSEQKRLVRPLSAVVLAKRYDGRTAA